MGLLQLVTESDTFNVDNSSSGGSRDLLSCLTTGNTTTFESYLGVAVTGLVFHSLDAIVSIRNNILHLSIQDHLPTASVLLFHHCYCYN